MRMSCPIVVDGYVNSLKTPQEYFFILCPRVEFESIDKVHRNEFDVKKCIEFPKNERVKWFNEKDDFRASDFG